jgi:hypothetical protein
METKRIERLLIVLIALLLVNIIASFKQYQFVSQLSGNMMFVYKCNVYTGNVTLAYPSQEFLEQHRVKSER